jgi:hypothetical protein
MVFITITGWLRDADDPIGQHGESFVESLRIVNTIAPLDSLAEGQAPGKTDP